MGFQMCCSSVFWLKCVFFGKNMERSHRGSTQYLYIIGSMRDSNSILLLLNYRLICFGRLRSTYTNFDDHRWQSKKSKVQPHVIVILDAKLYNSHLMTVDLGNVYKVWMKITGSTFMMFHFFLWNASFPQKVRFFVFWVGLLGSKQTSKNKVFGSLGMCIDPWFFIHGGFH